MITLLEQYLPALLRGAATTLELAIIIWIGGLVLGTLVGFWRASQTNGIVRNVLTILALALSSVPVLVYLLWGHYPLQASLGISVPPFVTAAVVLMCYNSLIVTEFVRGGVEDFPVAYEFAARVNGVHRRVYFREIVIPLVFRAALPGYLVSQVSALHLTLFASLISVDELFRVAQQINSIEYNAVSVFSLLAIFYFCLSFPLLILSRLAQARLTRMGLER